MNSPVLPLPPFPSLRRSLTHALAALAIGASLVAVPLGAGCSKHDSTEEAAAETYYCPMHPTYTSKQPGHCPICSMTLVKRTAPNAGDAPGAASSSAPMAVEGRVAVRIPLERQQLIGVTTDLVREIPLERSVRTVGRVAYDESRVQHVHVKFGGYVEHPYIDFVGAVVKRGDKLFDIYSPELYSTQAEYLLAKRSRDQTRAGASAETLARAASLVEAARQRLLLWDIQPSEIRRLEQRGEPGRTLAIHSPYDGVVVERKAIHGMQLSPGDTVYAIADLSQVWVLADVYEYELPYVQVGQRARMTLSYLPGRTWEGTVTYVYPTVESKTRTVKVRLEFANPELVLKPDMFADVVMAGDLGNALVVPERAVIMTGLKSVVFVDLGDGRLEPRVVDLGAHLSNGYEVRGGLVEGERVVTSGNFLIDSESRLEAAVTGARSAAEPAAGDGGGAPGASHPTSGPSAPPSLPGGQAGHVGHAGHGGGA